jgi:hypothetical protein
MSDEKEDNDSAWRRWYASRPVPGSAMRLEGEEGRGKTIHIACPSCGHESDYGGDWHRGEPYDFWPRVNEEAWCCWECNALHPTIAHYRALVDLWKSQAEGFEEHLAMAEAKRATLESEHETLREQLKQAKLENRKGALDE